jgi:hypothetical protein
MTMTTTLKSLALLLMAIGLVMSLACIWKSSAEQSADRSELSTISM